MIWEAGAVGARGSYGMRPRRETRADEKDRDEPRLKEDILRCDRLASSSNMVDKLRTAVRSGMALCENNW